MIKEKTTFTTLFLYFAWGGFIVGWWSLAFPPLSPPSTPIFETNSSLSLKTATLLNELSPLQREVLHQALAGNFQLMLKLIDQWDQEALFLASKGVSGVERLPAESHLQAHVIGHLLANSSEETLRKLNCKMNLDWIYDDTGHRHHIGDHFSRYLPQTYLAASFMLAIARPHEIIALPRGLREFKQLYSSDTLAEVPNDIGSIRGEKLSLARPDLAFVAPYSHPPSLETLRNQNIALFSIQMVNTIKEIQESLLKVGHASNHILEAQLLSIFMEASLLSIDNRLQALQDKYPPGHPPSKLLFLSHRQNYALPTKKSLTGQLMARALTHSPYLSGEIPDTLSDWRIPIGQEQILQSAPDVMIIAEQKHLAPPPPFALRQTEAHQSNQIFYIDEAIQESPTQYIVLAYYDIFQALASL